MAIKFPEPKMVKTKEITIEVFEQGEGIPVVLAHGFPGYGDLFDLKEDPLELNNLWTTSPELRHEMVERLLFEVIKQQSIYPKKQAMA